jgi:hypothetical protein
VVPHGQHVVVACSKRGLMLIQWERSYGVQTSRVRVKAPYSVRNGEEGGTHRVQAPREFCAGVQRDSRPQQAQRGQFRPLC